MLCKSFVIKKQFLRSKLLYINKVRITVGKMTDLRINNFNKAIASPQFRANENVTKPTELDDKKGLSKGAKWAIGTGLAILGTYGIYLATKGKVKPKTNPKPTPATTGQNNPIQEIKEFALDVFKKEGKFDKGKAILSDGTKYTGNITAECKTDGSKVVMEYVDGVLQKSTKTAKDGTKVFDKTYTYADDGLIKEIKKNGETILDENKLIEIYKKANTKLIQDNELANRFPNVIKNLEEIYADVNKIEVDECREFCIDELKRSLRSYGYDISKEGKVIKITSSKKIAEGLADLRSQNKILLEELKFPIYKRFISIIENYQTLDIVLTDLPQNELTSRINNNIKKILDDLGYKFKDFDPKNYDGIYGIEKQPLEKIQLVCRAIVDKNGNTIAKGKVYLPMNF